MKRDQKPKIDWRVYTINPEKLLVRDLIIEIKFGKNSKGRI